MDAKLEEKLSITNTQLIWKARNNIQNIIVETPLISSPVLSDRMGAEVYLKLENLQDIGAFKVRGAANKIISLTEEKKQCGVATFSTGNHGLAVAYVARKLGIKATVCISSRVPLAKVDAIRRAGADIVIIGESQDDAEKYCYELQEKHGMTVIKPFDDLEVIAGQGTIGLELLEALPDLDAVIVPLSGGGLIAGVAIALKSVNPMIQVIGVSMEGASVMNESIQAGKPVVLQEQDTLADSLLGGIGLNNEYTFDIVKNYVDDIILVSEDEIAQGMTFMVEHHRMVVEGAAAVGIAAIIQGKIQGRYKKVGTIITGNNIDFSVILEILQNYKREEW
ncbi:hydroxyectoine utilization dehydratase EutB [Sporosarcina sp. Marseille-Q4063]|uniref:hydroxyectoine utilization dehydratase EutB n=1 Tax=Sporosarcina sp. Marseille-Q4063 TaxID=2810514 RepID=UPI001BB05B48|nr:hydroxyectoine utilization dehydratase EutB [Sporosarcina sp. Marseille-Q4063]QUW22554.1 hydroxyectoine utilization dehydratase EutB [Sporosarcina sp. Marseille-Q4063]